MIWKIFLWRIGVNKSCEIISRPSSNPSSLLILNARIVDSSSDFFGALLITEGKIKAILTFDDKKNKKVNFIVERFSALNISVVIHNTEIIDAQGLTVMPAFIDMHVHFRYPGQEQKEDLHSGLAAAESGGFCCVCAMPNTTPVVSSYETACSIEEQASSISSVKLFQVVSLTKGFKGTDITHIDELNFSKTPLISEDGHEVENSAVMLEAMKKASAQDLIVSCHCEDPFLAAAAKPFRKTGLKALSKNDTETAYKNFEQATELLALAEDTATLRNIELAKNAGCHIHIAHCSTAISLDAVRRAKKNGQKISCEVTPHHLGLSIDDRKNLIHLVNPPLRPETDQLAVVNAIKDGTADVISTDHAPHTMQDKKNGSCGFTGLETSFSICNTKLVQTGYISLSKLSELMSAHPAELLHLNKGKFIEGFDGDIVIVDPVEKRIVTGKNFKSKGKYSPFEGFELSGVVKKLYIKGISVFTD